VVEPLPLHPEVKGLNPATDAGTSKQKNGKKDYFIEVLNTWLIILRSMVWVQLLMLAPGEKNGKNVIDIDYGERQKRKDRSLASLSRGKWYKSSFQHWHQRKNGKKEFHCSLDIDYG
jgi:hypothetical protein